MPDFCTTDWMRGWSGNMARLTFPRATNVCYVWWMTSIYHRSNIACFSTSFSHYCQYFKFYDSYRQEHFIFNVQYIIVDNELDMFCFCLFFIVVENIEMKISQGSNHQNCIFLS